MAKRPDLASGIGRRVKVPKRTHAQIAMTPELRAYFQEAADFCEMEFSPWVRVRLLEAADRDLHRKGRGKKKGGKR